MLDHSAIRKAYPSVVTIDDYGSLDNSSILDASGNKVTVAQSNIDAARVELDKLNYIQHRVGTATTSGYIRIQDRLDQLYHDIESGKFGADAKTGSWFVGITSVKTAFPKP